MSELTLFDPGPPEPRTRRKMQAVHRPGYTGEQMDATLAAEEPTFAAAVRRSIRCADDRRAARLGFRARAMCRWCDDILIAPDYRTFWQHQITSERQCRAAQRRRGIWRMKEDGGVVEPAPW